MQVQHQQPPAVIASTASVPTAVHSSQQVQISSSTPIPEGEELDVKDETKATKKKKTTGTKRKAKTTSSTTDSPSTEQDGAADEKPPATKRVKKTKKESTKTTKKGATTTKDSNDQAGSTVPDAEAKKEVIEVDEHGVEKGALNEYLPKDEMGKVSFVSQLVVDSDVISNESVKTTNAMRSAFKDGTVNRPSVLSRTKEGSDDFTSFSFGDEDDTGTEGESKAAILSVMDKAILHDAKVQALCKQVLSPLRMNYTPKAIAALSDGMQSHFRTLIESAIGAFLKRTNRKAMEHFNQMDKILSSTVSVPNSSAENSSTVTLQPGEVKPDMMASYALMFAPDERERIAEELSNEKELLANRQIEVESSLRDHLQQAAELLKKGQKKSTKADTATDLDANVPWWTKEAELEKRGKLTWEQLAISRLKHKVAALHDLGPKTRKKPRKEKTTEEGKTDAGQTMDVDETGQSDNIEENVVATSTSEEVQSKESSNTSPHSKSPFPNYDINDSTEEDSSTKTVYRVTFDDARVALAKHTGRRHLRGDHYSEAYGNVLKMALSASQN